MATVPDTSTFSLQDVYDVIEIDEPFAPEDLAGCFSYSEQQKFDPRYVISGVQALSEFRNYGYDKGIEDKVDSQYSTDGVLFDHGLVLADPDYDRVYTLKWDDDDDCFLEMFTVSSSAIAASGKYILMGSNNNITDWIVVDNDHIYVADKYESGGTYYFRIRWYEYNGGTPGFILNDTESTTVSSTVYNARDPKITATDSYIWMTNFNNSTSTTYVYSMSIGASSFGTKTSRKTFTGGANMSALYNKNDVLFLAHFGTTVDYLFSYTIGAGVLTQVDFITTSESIVKMAGEGDTILYGISDTVDDTINYIKHDLDGDNLVFEDAHNWATIGLDWSPIAGGVIACSIGWVEGYYHDSNDNLAQATPIQECTYDRRGDSAEETYTIMDATACSQHASVVVFAYYDGVINSNDEMRLFLFPMVDS